MKIIDKLKNDIVSVKVNSQEEFDTVMKCLDGEEVSEWCGYGTECGTYPNIYWNGNSFDSHCDVFIDHKELTIITFNDFLKEYNDELCVIPYSYTVTETAMTEAEVKEKFKDFSFDGSGCVQTIDGWGYEPCKAIDEFNAKSKELISLLEAKINGFHLSKASAGLRKLKKAIEEV